MKDAKIDCTDGMLQKIIKEDDDAQKLESLPKFPEFFQTCEQNIEDPTTRYQSDMKTLNKEKNRHIIYCEQVLKAAEREAELESIKLIDMFKNQKKHKMRELAHQKDKDEDMIDKFEEDLMQVIDCLEDDLMGVEMKL